MQQEYFGMLSLQELSKILSEIQPQKIFLVTGKSSYGLSGAKEKLSKLLVNYPYVHFSDFSPNPKLRDIEKGIAVYKKESCDLVIAIGGGSVIDVAKSINILAAQENDPQSYITNENKIENKGNTLVAIPTTSGSGSEATHFAVVYINKTKYSLAHQSILPDHVILDPELTLSLSKRITACTGMDALSQAIEAYWSVNSTDESKNYSQEAIKLISGNLVVVTNNPTEKSRTAMIKAANLAGKAINISKTTACHAISYPITSYFSIPHGHAVALTLGELLIYNSGIEKQNCLDKRGPDYIKQTIIELCKMLGTDSVFEARDKINQLIDSVGLNRSLVELTGTPFEEIKNVIRSNLNLERMGNNPRFINEKSLTTILDNLK